jgi:hypothetical protein
VGIDLNPLHAAKVTAGNWEFVAIDPENLGRGCVDATFPGGGTLLSVVPISPASYRIKRPSAVFRWQTKGATLRLVEILQKNLIRFCNSYVLVTVKHTTG